MNAYIVTVLTFAIALTFLRRVDYFAHRDWRYASQSHDIVRKNLFRGVS